MTASGLRTSSSRAQMVHCVFARNGWRARAAGWTSRATIEEIVSRVQAIDLDKEVVIVDDGSTDGTREFLTDLAFHAHPNPGTMMLPQTQRELRADNIRIFFQEQNRGKGAALRRGFQ